MVAAVIAVGVTGCLPYPIETPRVEPGVTLGIGAGGRVLVADSVKGTAPGGGLSVYPEFTFSSSVGFAHADGTGPAFRIGGTLGLPGPIEGDAFVQFPRVGPIIAGVGGLLPAFGSSQDRLTGAIPYGTVGWEMSGGSMLYGSLAALSIHHLTSPESTLTAEAIVVGYQHTEIRDSTKGSDSWRAFVAIFHGNRGFESNDGLVGPTGAFHSLVVAGVVVDIARPFSVFNRPRVPRRRPPLDEQPARLVALQPVGENVAQDLEVDVAAGHDPDTASAGRNDGRPTGDRHCNWRSTSAFRHDARSRDEQTNCRGDLTQAGNE
jgi:hypothetical protein